MNGKRLIIMLVVAMVFCFQMQAKETPNERQAREMFDKTYKMAFGPQGSMIGYAVNIIGIYKTEGTIWYKGKKSKFVEDKFDAYCDGVTYWQVNRKKRVVTIYRADDEERDKYATKFTFQPDNYHYSIASTDEGYAITLRAKKGVKGIKEARVLLDRQSRYPKSLRIKVGIFHTTIRISKFKSGGIADETFVFPRKKYKDYQFVDKR